MKSLLYICHSYHYKTRSNRFLVELLSPHFSITEFGFDPYSDTEDAYRALPAQHFDIVLCFQILPPREVLERRISFTSGVFFPMFDAGPAPESHLWADYRDFLIINFCRAMHENCLSLGLNSRYIQYFPPEGEVTDRGREDSVFFWNRVEHIDINTVHRLFGGTNVTHVHLHSALDPGQKTAPLKRPWNVTLTRTSWFENKTALLDAMQTSALYVAPRLTEGIGMSFLEAMAIGRCVIAPDRPTMNEYIRHGENGILYDPDDIQPLELGDIRAMQEAARRGISEGHERWMFQKQDIVRWIEEKYAVDTAPMPRVTIVTCTRDIVRNRRQRWLARCLASVRNQHYAGEIEHLIIDGASNDGTLDFLKKHAPGVKILSEPDKGIYYAMNKGLALASGEYVAFLNSDDFYCSECAVADSIRTMLEQNAEASYADAFLIEQENERILASWRGSLDLIPFGQYPCHQSVFVRTERLRALGGFDTSLFCIADNLVMCALLGSGVRFARVNDHIVKFRSGGFSNDPKFRKRIQAERRARGQEEFHRFFGGGFTRQECDLLLDFRFRKKKPADVQPIGENLPNAAWRREFFRALFGQPGELLDWSGTNSGIPSRERLFCITTGDLLHYGYCRLKAVFGGRKEQRSFEELRERLGGRSLSLLIRNSLLCGRYKVLSRILWGNLRRHYRDRYLSLKARRQRIRLYSKQGRRKQV